MSETLREQLERQLAEPLHYVSQEARYFVLTRSRATCTTRAIFSKDARKRTMPVGLRGPCGRSFTEKWSALENLIVKRRRTKKCGSKRLVAPSPVCRR